MRPVLRRSRGAAILGAVALMMSAPVVGAEPPDGTGGQPDDGPATEYSDLVVALRDVDGLPIFAEFPVEGVTEYCVQPVATEPLPGLDPTGVVNPVDGSTVYPIPLMGASEELTEEDEVCDPEPAYAMYVSEAELERLNMARTTEDVLAQKLTDVMQRLLGTDQEVTLDPAGRLVIDGVVTDAGPEHAALFQSLMLTGTIPGLDAAYLDGGLADITPFGPWELAAVSLGAAASKFVPVSIDAAIYYNRITGVADPTNAWRAPALTLDGTNEKFVDYRGFTYNRDEVFPGCVTWLDVPTLTWYSAPIAEVAGFAELPPNAAADGTLSNVAGFAQLAADVRSMVFYLHEHEVIAGFYMDPVGQSTCEDQAAALTAPAVDFGPLPEEVVQTETFPMAASLYNPLDGEALTSARIRVTIDAVDGDFTDGSVVTATTPDEGEITFTPDAAGNLVGWWGPEGGFPVGVRYLDTTEFQVRVDEAAPVGSYNLTLDLIAPLDALDSPVATDTAVINVLDDALTARWTAFPGYVDQAVNQTVTARVFNPETAVVTPDGTTLRLTVVGPAADPPVAPAAADLQVYSDAVRITMVPGVDGSLVGDMPLLPLEPGAARSITWYVMVADGAPQGMYEITVEVVPAPDDTRAIGSPDTEDMYVGPAEQHGQGGENGGEGEEPDPTTPLSRTADAIDGELQLATWYLTNSTTSGQASVVLKYGDPGDVPVVGDWDGDGTMTVGVVRDGHWYLRSAAGGGMADSDFTFGDPGDVPVVGRWVDGDPAYYPGVIRGTTLYLRTSHTSGVATNVVSFGDPGDILMVGDWDGDGDDTPGVFRAGRFYLVNSLTKGTHDVVVAFGDPGDIPIVGRWVTGDRHLPGVIRGNTWYLRASQTSGTADTVFAYGDPQDIRLVGDWNGDGRDTAGVAR